MEELETRVEDLEERGRRAASHLLGVGAAILTGVYSHLLEAQADAGMVPHNVMTGSGEDFATSFFLTSYSLLIGTAGGNVKRTSYAFGAVGNSLLFYDEILQLTNAGYGTGDPLDLVAYGAGIGAGIATTYIGDVVEDALE